MSLILKIKSPSARVLDALVARHRWKWVYCMDCERYHRLDKPGACVRREVLALLRAAGLVPKFVQTESEVAHG